MRIATRSGLEEDCAISKNMGLNDVVICLKHLSANLSWRILSLIAKSPLRGVPINEARAPEGAGDGLTSGVIFVMLIR